MWGISARNLFRRPSRTFLAVLGIVIGVAAIISLVAVVDGVLYDVTSVIGKVQGIRVLQKDAAGPLFSSIDDSWESKLAAVRGVKGVVSGVAGRIRNINGNASGEFSAMQLIGIDFVNAARLDYFGINGELTEGRMLKPNEKGAAIIGTGIRDSYTIFVGNSIKVNGKKLKVVGIISLGSSLFSNQVIVGIEDARSMLSFPHDKVSFYAVALENPSDEKIISDTINFLYEDKGIKAFSTSDLSSMLGNVLDQIRLLVIFVAAISAFVAAIGILNTMLMSVVERFQEIGTLKAIGWTRFDVVHMILLESLFLGTLGGILGNLLGQGIAFAVHTVAGLTVLISPALMVETFLFAVAVAVLAGVYPAFVAADLDPIEALRFE